MILTFEQQQEIKPISENNAYKWEQIAKEVYNVKMLPLFGEDFMIDVEDNLNNPDYSALLNGLQYTYSGDNYRHAGLRATLAYLVYAQYIQESGLEDTFTGLVRQARNETEKANDGDIGRVIKFAYQNAASNTTRVKFWLDNVADFPKWCKTETTTKRFSKTNFYGIKKK